MKSFEQKKREMQDQVDLYAKQSIGAKCTLSLGRNGRFTGTIISAVGMVEVTDSGARAYWKVVVERNGYRQSREITSIPRGQFVSTQ